jgi:hypothetical protein
LNVVNHYFPKKEEAALSGFPFLRALLGSFVQLPPILNEAAVASTCTAARPLLNLPRQQLAMLNVSLSSNASTKAISPSKANAIVNVGGVNLPLSRCLVLKQHDKGTSNGVHGNIVVAIEQCLQ